MIFEVFNPMHKREKELNVCNSFDTLYQNRGLKNIIIIISVLGYSDNVKKI